MELINAFSKVIPEGRLPLITDKYSNSIVCDINLKYIAQEQGLSLSSVIKILLAETKNH